jgi:hypothetical protein
MVERLWWRVSVEKAVVERPWRKCCDGQTMMERLWRRDNDGMTWKLSTMLERLLWKDHEENAVMDKL